MNTLKILTLPAYHIKDFDSLPMQFRAVTADILASKQKILAKGDLCTALRASMSIPVVFEPVLMDSCWLIDGGVVNNFPTDVARSMGADIIIGSDVSKPTTSIEELNNLNAVLSQTMMLVNNELHPRNIKLCDIYIQHHPYLSYTTADFDKCETLYEEGKMVVQKNLESLVKLSDQLKRFSQKKIRMPLFDNRIVFDTIIYNNVSPSNLNLLKDRMNIIEGRAYTKADMENAINRAMGTELLRKIDVAPINVNNKEGLLITAHENKNHRISGALYFDTYREAGIIGNYTGRNFFGKTSKIVATVDIAQQPKFYLMAQKNFGHNEQWWFRTEITGRRLKQKQSTQSMFGKDYADNAIAFTGQINKNLQSLNGYLGMGFNYKFTKIHASLSNKNNNGLLAVEDYLQKSMSVDIRFVKNSLNKVFYATKGCQFSAVITQSLYQQAAIKHFDEPRLPASTLNNFLKVQINYHKRQSISSKLTTIVATSIGLMHSYQQDRQSYFEQGYSDFFFIGGSVPLTSENQISNAGLFEQELFAPQITQLNVGLQYTPYTDFYITPSMNYTIVGFNSIGNYLSNFLKAKTNWNNRTHTSYLFAMGLTASYNSFLGPIELTVSKTTGIHQPRVFFNLGIPFNR